MSPQPRLVKDYRSTFSWKLCYSSKKLRTSKIIYGKRKMTWLSRLQGLHGRLVKQDGDFSKIWPLFITAQESEVRSCFFWMPPLIGRNLEFIGRVQSISLLERYKMMFGDLLMYQKILDNAIKRHSRGWSLRYYCTWNLEIATASATENKCLSLRLKLL